VTTQTAGAPDLAWSSSADSPPAPTWSGPVPTRPLALGEILDGAVSLLRLYPGPLLGLAAIVMTIQLVLTVPVQYLSQDFTFTILDPVPSSGGSGLDPLLALFGVALSTTIVAVIAGACAGVVSGITASVVGRATAGQPVRISTVWADVRPRLWALIGISLLIGLATGIGALAVLVGSWIVGAAFAVVVPAMMLERLGPFRAMKRGWELTFTSFGAFMRLLFIRILATVVIAGIWQSLIGLPFLIAGQLIATVNAPQSPSPGQLLLSVFVGALGTMLAGVVVTPFVGCIDALLYVDRRMRAEGYDIELGQRLRRASRGVA
jgi:MFS family permease